MYLIVNNFFIKIVPRKNTREQLQSLQTIVDFCSNGDVTVKEVEKRLRRETDKIDRMLIVENLFAVTEGGSTSLADKSQNMVDSIAQGLVETLKNELAESRNIAENQRKRIKDLETEKEEFLESQLHTKHDGVSEMNDVIEHLRKSLVRNIDTSIDGEDTLKVVRRDIGETKKTIRVISDGLDKSYKTIINKMNEVSELKETIKELEEQKRGHTQSIEELHAQKQYLKTQIDHCEAQHRITNDELTTVQRRLTAAEQERKVFSDENSSLKGGKANMQDFCSNLSGQNEKLLTKLKTVQDERDGLFDNLQEQLHRTGELTNDNNELENKLETLENVVAKLRREYQNQTREVSATTRENEDLRISLQDSEQNNTKIRRSVKAIETSNKDLEDQIFQISNDFQKTKNDNEKLRNSQREQQHTIEELREIIEFTTDEKNAVESELKEVSVKQKQTQERNRELSQEIDRDKTVNDKQKTLSSSFEKLLLKFIHQRKQLLSIMKLSNTIKESSFQLCSIQSIEFKNAIDLKFSTEATDKEIDNTFNVLSESISTRFDDINRYESFLNDILEHSKRVSNDQADSCYSTDDVSSCHVPRLDVGGGVRGLNALKVKYRNEYSRDTLNKLSDKIKRAFSIEETDLTGSVSIDVIEKKRKITNRKIQQLKTKLRNRKSIERGLQHKMCHMKKEINSLREDQKMNRLKAAVSCEQLSRRSPPKSLGSSPRNAVGVNVLDLKEELESTRVEIEKLRKTVEEYEDHECKRVVIVKLEPIERRMLSLKEKLELRVNCSLCEQHRADSSVDTLENKVEQISEQREYMLEHMKFTNKRLEVLLNALKGREEANLDSQDINNNTVAELTKLNHHNSPAKQLLSSPSERQSSVNSSPHKMKNNNSTTTMKKAVSILELTKAISITDIHAVDETSAIDAEQRDVIILVKDMNDTMETVLREARSKITDARISTKPVPGRDTDDQNKRTDDESTSSNVGGGVGGKYILEVVPRSQLLKKENEMKRSLENAQQKLDNLSEFLEKREAELKQRDVIIAQLNKEYEALKAEKTDQSGAAISTRDRLIDQYRDTITRLEKENQYLQVVVRELREELLNLQKSLKKEADTQQHQQEFINELNICKASLEKSLDKVAYELNIVRTDRDHLMQTINSLHHIPPPSTAYWYNGGGGVQNYHGYNYNNSGRGISSTYNGGSGYHQENVCYNNGDCGCEMCSFPDFSEQSTAIPFSEDDWASLCDDCTSVHSDTAINCDGVVDEDVVSSSESQKTTTSSRVAKKIKTGEAVVRVKKSYAKETRTRKPMLSPKLTARGNNSNNNGSLSPWKQRDPVEEVSLTGSEFSNRVQGRRELGKNSRHHSYSHHHNHHDNQQQHGENYGRRASFESNSTVMNKQQQRPPSRPVSRNSMSSQQQYDGPPFASANSFQPTSVTNVDDAISAAAHAQNSYYEERGVSSGGGNNENTLSPRDQLATPFLNQTFEKKKKRKSFLNPFGKK